MVEAGCISFGHFGSRQMKKLHLVSYQAMVANEDNTERLLEDLLTEIQLLSDEVQQLKTQTRRIVGLQEGCMLLGICTLGSLKYKIDSGVLRIGIEVIDQRQSGFTEANWGLDIDKCRARLRQINRTPW